jgi:transcriptional regulator with XRE-family HTH domain
MALSGKIKRLREKNGLTQSELASRIGLTRSAVNAWEMGNATPSTAIIIKLARLFSVSTDYLLGVDGEEKLPVNGLTRKEIESVQSVIDCFRDR